MRKWIQERAERHRDEVLVHCGWFLLPAMRAMLAMMALVIVVGLAAALWISAHFGMIWLRGESVIVNEGEPEVEGGGLLLFAATPLVMALVAAAFFWLIMRQMHTGIAEMARRREQLLNEHSDMRS